MQKTQCCDPLDANEIFDTDTKDWSKGAYLQKNPKAKAFLFSEREFWISARFETRANSCL